MSNDGLTLLELSQAEDDAHLEPEEPTPETCTVPNPSPIFPTWLRARLDVRGEDWTLTGLEMYADEACTVLISDDIDFAKLPDLRSIELEISRVRDVAADAKRRRRVATAAFALDAAIANQRRSELAELGV